MRMLSIWSKELQGHLEVLFLPYKACDLQYSNHEVHFKLQKALVGDERDWSKKEAAKIHYFA